MLTRFSQLRCEVGNLEPGFQKPKVYALNFCRQLKVSKTGCENLETIQ